MRRTLGLLAASIPFFVVALFWLNAKPFTAFGASTKNYGAGVLLFGLGSLICVLNAWLSFGRPLFYKIRHGHFDGYRLYRAAPYSAPCPSCSALGFL